MNDPYKTLGVSRDASDDEIKTAYRNLAKKYHPDHNPGDAAAARKMNEINAAYDAIKSGDAQNQYGYGGQGAAYGYNPWQNGAYTGAWGGSATQDERTELRAAENYIRSGHYREAMTALSGVEESGRNGRWYYLAAVANMGMGNKIAAIEYARIAHEMEPGNEEFTRLLDQLEYGGNMYNSYSSGFPRVSFTGSNGLCMGLCVAQFCLRAFCRC